jgi:dTDP-4-amino-4,6-dideoxygalactose transaminase
MNTLLPGDGGMHVQIMWRIPLSDLNYDEHEERAVLEVLRSKWLTMGPKTAEFEALAAGYLGARHAIAVANCTCALELAYAAALRRHEGTGRTSVLVPDVTFVATANAAMAAGGQPVLCDIESPDIPLLSVGTAVRSGSPGEWAVIATVHYAGFDANAQALRQLAHDRGALLIEDAAHAIGGLGKDGAKLGTIGDVGCFSFFSNKNLATGEGGMVVTNDDEIADEVRLRRSHGMSSPTFDRHRVRAHGYDVTVHGNNHRCTEITAALGIEQLKKLDAGNGRRRGLYRLYVEMLQAWPEVAVAFSDRPDAIDRSSCHILPLLCESGELRDRIRETMDVAGVQTSHHYPPVHGFTFYRALADSGRLHHASCPNAESFAARQITLPLHPGLKEVEVEEICALVGQAIKCR